MTAKIKMIFITMTFCILKIYTLIRILNATNQGSDFLVITERHTKFWDLGMVLELVLCTRGPFGCCYYSKSYTGLS